MKYPGSNDGSGGNLADLTMPPSTHFMDQVQSMTSLFDQWNDCERTVVLYALLKRMPYSNLKFLQLSIEYNIAQNVNNSIDAPNSGKFQLLESNSNNGVFLAKLISFYKGFRGAPVATNSLNVGRQYSDADSVLSQMSTSDYSTSSSSCSRSSSQMLGTGMAPYESKEDILNDILTYLPLLKPGNDEAKSIYISFIPVVVGDAIKQIVPTDTVQQILSYLLIHPAVTSDDRRSLTHWLHRLEDHISSSYISPLVNGKHSGSRVSLNKSTGSYASFSMDGMLSSNPLHWSQQRLDSIGKGTVIKGVGQSPYQDVKNESMVWNFRGSNEPLGRSQEINLSCEEKAVKEFRKTIGRNVEGSAIGKSISTTSSLTSSSSSSSSSSISGAMNSSSFRDQPKVIGSRTSFAESATTSVTTTEEDHHISFSKNGTEILDFDCDDNDKSNTQIAFEAPPPPLPVPPPAVTDFLTVPAFLDNCFCAGSSGPGHCPLMNNTLKTRRSNSLTTAPVTIPHINTSSSTENLLNLKPRSFSLSIENSHSALVTSGSETRLDELKPNNYLKFSTNNPGMNTIGQWLKSLRLHKYVWLFSNITYEQMLEITEDYLANLSVTKGARHKLVLCIQKLKERSSMLAQMEKRLASMDPQLPSVLDDLTNMVLTPMKAIDPFNKDDIAGHFIKVIEIVAMLLISKPVSGPQDEECVTTFLWIMERALHNEAFLTQMNLLKELKFKVSKIKLQFVNKGHFSKSMSAAGNLNKSRWSSNGKKSSQSPASSHGDGTKRKNSNSSQISNYNSVVQHLQQYQQVMKSGSSDRVGGGNASHSPSGHKIVPCANNAQQTYNKSSSYPNFSQHLKISNLPHHASSQQQQGGNVKVLQPLTCQKVNHQMHFNQQPQIPVVSHQGGPQQQQQHLVLNGSYHRHSLNNIMGMTPGLNASRIEPNPAVVLNPQISDVVIKGSSNCSLSGGSDTKSRDTSSRRVCENNENIDIGNQCADKNNIGDINSRLEFLCLQMTEQAIN